MKAKRSNLFPTPMYCNTVVENLHYITNKLPHSQWGHWKVLFSTTIPIKYSQGFFSLCLHLISPTLLLPT